MGWFGAALVALGGLLTLPACAVAPDTAAGTAVASGGAAGAGVGVMTSGGLRPALPVPGSLMVNAVGNVFDWNRMPAGVNLPDCKPAPGQYPVILVHGTFANAMLAYSALAPTLHNAGLCVYAYNYGGRSPDAYVHGLVSMEESAQRLADEVQRVRTLTGSAKVNLVGHSQGGTLIHYYAKVLGGASNVDALVAVAPSLRGTERVSRNSGYTYCVACGQQSPDSALIRRLNDGPIAQPGNRNYVIATTVDWVVRPVEKQFIREPGVTNVLLQDLYPWRWATHSTILYDSDALRIITGWILGVEQTEPARAGDLSTYSKKPL